MKKSISSDKIKLGMKFSSPVFFQGTDSMFIAEDKPITKFHLDAINNWQIKELETFGHIIEE